VDKEFVIDGYKVVMRNSTNPYVGNWFSFYIFDKDGKCVFMGDDGEHKELNQELAESIYQMYLNHQKRERPTGKIIDPNSPLARLMQKHMRRLER
jgi:hypothetical protein